VEHRKYSEEVGVGIRPKNLVDTMLKDERKWKRITKYIEDEGNGNE